MFVPQGKLFNMVGRLMIEASKGIPMKAVLYGGEAYDRSEQGYPNESCLIRWGGL